MTYRDCGHLGAHNKVRDSYLHITSTLNADNMLHQRIEPWEAIPSQVKIYKQKTLFPDVSSWALAPTQSLE